MALKLVVRRLGDAPDSQAAVSYAFSQPRVVIGRSPGADVRLPELAVSDVHAVLEEAVDRILVSDQGSTNGTRVNGVDLVAKRPRSLSDGDELEIGGFLIRFSPAHLIGLATSRERTASLAKKLLCDLLGRGAPAAEPPSVRVAEGPDVGTCIELPPAPALFRVGRDQEAELALRDPDVSRLHAAFERDLDGVLVRDLDSKNGIEVNGKRLRERRLRDGDRVRLGVTLLVFEDPAERALKALEGKPDALVTRTTPRVEVVGPAEPSAPPPVMQAPTLPPAQAAGALDVAVYGLALLILVASLVGLWWLFGG
jgi:pSer/pThr/pTyr-binding forkhead associated (FHA) protein